MSSPNLTGNYTFIPSPQQGQTSLQALSQGLYYYANADKSPEMAAESRKYFGPNPYNFADPASRDYFVGSAILREINAPNILAAYTALNIPKPQTDDPRTLISTLGKNTIENHRKEYDRRKAIVDSAAAKLSQQYQDLISGSITPESLNPSEQKDFKDAFGFTPKDISLAGQIIKTREAKTAHKGIASLAATTLDLGHATLSAAGQAFKGNFKDAVRQFSASDPSRLTAQEDLSNAAFLSLESSQLSSILAQSENPKALRDLAASLYYTKVKERDENSNGFMRVLRKADRVAGEIPQGFVEGIKHVAYSFSSTDNIEQRNNWGGEQVKEQFKEYVKESKEQTIAGQRAVASLSDAEDQAFSDLKEESKIGVLESASTFAIDIAPLMNPYTAAGSVGRLFTENAGRGFNAIADAETDAIPAHMTQEVYSKAAAQAIITYATRSVPLKYGSKLTAKLIGKNASSAIGRFTHSSLGHAAVNAANQGIQFATVVPAMDAALNTAWDAAFVSDPRLETGYAQFKKLYQDLQSSRYWQEQFVVGAIFSAAPSIHYHRNKKQLRTVSKINGLKDSEIDTIIANTQPEQLPQALVDAVNKKIAGNPAQALADATTNLRETLEEAQAYQKEQEGHAIRQDPAKEASFQLSGISFTPGKTQDTLTLRYGGKVDPATGNFVHGEHAAEMSLADAALFLGAHFNAKMANIAESIRNNFGNSIMLDAISKNLTGDIQIVSLANPTRFQDIVTTGQHAQKAIDSLAKKLREESKQEDGTYTLSEKDALTQAAQTIDPTLHKTHTLAELVSYGKHAQSRIEQEQARTQARQNVSDFVTNAYVLTKGSRSDASLKRIFHIYNGASTREVMEEYAEQYLADYLAESRDDLADIWRTLHSLQESTDLKGGLVSLHQRQDTATLGERLLNGEDSSTITHISDRHLLRQDVVEGLSRLLVSDLRYRAAQADPSIPEHARPLLDAQMHSLQLMQQEMALGHALHIANQTGILNETASRLLNLLPEQITKLLQTQPTPTANTYHLANLRAQQRAADALYNNFALSPEEVDAHIAAYNADAQTLQNSIDAQEAAADEPFKEAADQAAKLPENQGKTEPEIRLQVSNKSLDRKETDLSEQADAQTPADTAERNKIAALTTNGKALQTDDGTTICYMGMLPIASLKLMPNFKTGSSVQTGEVHPLKGNYHPDHDPIRILLQQDGTPLVMSGRHRLAHAQRAGVSRIVAYIYPETAEHDLTWARFKDIEWNIKDDQATPQDVALLVRGELIDGIPPLSAQEIETMGITRQGSRSLLGYEIGKNASADLISAWQNDPKTFTNNMVHTIALTSQDPTVQREGIRCAQNGDGIRRVQEAMGIAADKQQHLKDSGIPIQLDLFGNEDPTDTLYSNFITDFARQQTAQINTLLNTRKLADKIAKSSNIKDTIQGSGIKLDTAAYNRIKNKKDILAALTQELHRWQHPWTNMPTLADTINKAFAAQHPDAWAEMQRRKAELTQPDSDPADTTPSAIQGDIPSASLFDASASSQEATTRLQPPTFADFSISGLHASAHNFRKFSTDYMGSGEGAQAYGWGLYFAENPKTNRAYFRQFNKEHTTLAYQQNGNRIPEPDFSSLLNNIFSKHATPQYPATILTSAIRSLLSNKFIKDWNINAEIAFLQQRVDKGQQAYAPLLAALKEIKDKNLTIALIQEFATNYKVALNVSKDDLLSWDEGHVPHALLKQWKDYCAQHKLGQQKLAFANTPDSKLPDISGQVFYRQYLEPTLGSDKAASMWLYDHGYKGIKHVDAATRHPKVKHKTHNFIIFNDADIKVTAVNETGRWSLTEGWQAYNDPTADFSLSAEQNLQNWQLDPTAGLGELGHFGDNISRKLAPVGVANIDTRLSQLQNSIRRRQKEVLNMHDTKDLEILIAELNNIVDLVDFLPQGYSFGKEPYIQFLNTYATLIRHADPKKAGKALPMHQWDKKMANSFRKQFNRILTEDMLEMEQSEFADLYSPFLSLIDIQTLRQAADNAREEAGLKFDFAHADQPKTARLAQQRRDAQQEAAEQALEANKHISDTIYRAIGQMRATRLVDKLLARIYLKIDQYRKDLTLRKIGAAIHSITPRKQKNGKPVKGTVTKDTYNTVLSYYRLLRLTKGQKDAFEESSTDLADKQPEDIIDIPTYDEQGEPITLHVTKQEYETFASLDAMSADQAAAAQQAIGTYIAHGKNAWQIIAQEQQQQVTDFCAPIYQSFAETRDDLAKRRRNEAASVSGNKGFLHLIRKFLTGSFNDAQLFDTVANRTGLEQFRKVQNAIARAHTYKESAELQNARNAIVATLNAMGYENVDPDNLTKQQRKDFARFTDEINERITLPKDKAITLTPQPPDFKTRVTDTLRNSLRGRLSQVIRKKNYDRHELAAVLQRLENTMPKKLFQEAWQLYGTHGDPSLFFGDIEKAFQNIFPEEKFGHLTNINKTISTKAEEQLANWQKTADLTPSVITEITRNEAAYRVLLSEQSDLADSLRRQGYTPQVIQQLKDIAGPQMMQLAYSMRTLMNARMETLKQIYENTYGTPFPAVENYFRAFFDAGSKEANDAQLEGLAFGAHGKNAGSMRLFYTRVKHNHPILDTMSVTHAYQIGMKEQTNIIAYSDPHTYRHIGEFMSKVLANRKGNTHLTSCLDNAVGIDVRDAIQEHTKNMFRLYGKSDAYSSTANRAVRDIGTAATYTLLLARITSIAKNAVAQFNTLGGSDLIGIRDWFKSRGRVLLGTSVISPKEIAKDPIIADRFKGWDIEAYTDALFQQAGVKSALNPATRLARRGLSAFGALDRYYSAKGAATLYDAVYRKLQQTNPTYTKEALHTEAMAEVEKSFNLKGQPMDWTQRPLWASRNSFMTASYYFLGGESWNTFANACRHFVNTIVKSKNLSKWEKTKALRRPAAIWATYGISLGLLNYAFNFLLDDDEHWQKRSFLGSMGFSALLGPIAGIPIISSIAAELFEWGGRKAGINMPYLSTPSYLPMGDISNQLNNFSKVISEKSSSWDKLIAANDTIRSILFITLLSNLRPTTTTGAAVKTTGIIGAAVSNLVDTFLKGIRALDERAVTPVSDPSAPPKEKVKKAKQSISPKQKQTLQRSSDLFPF